MVNISANINKANNHTSPQLIKHNEEYTVMQYLYRCYRFYDTLSHNLRYTAINLWCTGIHGDALPLINYDFEKDEFKIGELGGLHDKLEIKTRLISYLVEIVLGEIIMCK